MSLPGSATIPANRAERQRAAQESGRQIVRMIQQGTTARRIINRQGIENAIRVNAAIGGSTNAILHMLALAYEADVDLTVDDFEELSRTTPHIARMNPAGTPNLPGFHEAGGVPAVMKEILPLLHGNALTVSGKTVVENVAGAEVCDRGIIRTMADPWSRGGGLAVLRGPLAIVRDGDLITIDISGRRLHLHISDGEIKARQAGWKRPEPKFKKGYLALYARLAESADKGAIIRHKI